MSDSGAKDLLLSRLRADDSDFWKILRQLGDLEEEQRRPILRNHVDAGVKGDDDIIEMRIRLDQVLGAITLFEAGRELRIVEAADPLPHHAQLAKLCNESEAFLHYVNTYLYYGIRFYAGSRIPHPGDPTLPPGVCPHSRPPGFALVQPPELHHSDFAAGALKRFLELPRSPATQNALDFLDDYMVEGDTPDKFERWLWDLYPETTVAIAARFSVIAEGLREWADQRSAFYLSLNPPSKSLVDKGPVHEPGAGFPGEPSAQPKPSKLRWPITGHLAARIGLADFYWLARLLRAEVSARASVTYAPRSWLKLLGLRAARYGNTVLEAALTEAEDVLRSVFDFTCDLIQNSIEITSEEDLRKHEPRFFPEITREFLASNATWRQVFDEELAEIEIQRAMRNFTPRPPRRTIARSTPAADGPLPSSPPPYWSKRISKGQEFGDLIGLSFSGGGIRSATFNLGVLQGLQQFDLLRQVDYLSTVSGGGFIGSWLVANVYRKSRWLAHLTNWDESLSYLRRYSKYLSPDTGILSADTWTMIAIWIRNAFLIQLTTAVWLAVILLIALLLHVPFVSAKNFREGLLIGSMLAMAVLLSILLYNLSAGHDKQKSEGSGSGGIQALAVLPTWVASFCTAGLMWGDALNIRNVVPALKMPASYSSILIWAYEPWRVLLGFLGLGLFLIAAATITRSSWAHLALLIFHPSKLTDKEKTNALEDWPRTVFLSLVVTALSMIALYLEICGIFLVFLKTAAEATQYVWYAYVFGPWLVLAANIVSVVLFIGFCGRYAKEWTREWWTRFGSWLGIYGAAYLAAALAAVFGPLWILKLFAVKWGAGKIVAGGWIGTVISGLMSANSSKTNGDPSRSKSPWLEYLAEIAGVLFIVGAVLTASTVLYALLVEIGTDLCVSADRYWNVLAAIPLSTTAIALGVALFLGVVFSWAFEINIFSLNRFYRNRLVRCYLGATRTAPGLRHPQPFIAFDECDDIDLGDLRTAPEPEPPAEPAPSPDPRAFCGDFRGPFPIVNSSLNLGGSSDLALQTRHSASFFMTPIRCGSDRRKIGFVPTGDKKSHRQFAGGLKLGQAVAISGAAVSPNMGYSTSPLVSFLLTLFNIRLGWWFPNPGKNKWSNKGLTFGLTYLILELFGLADETSDYVNVSDGGHFENLGIYELIRRRCKVIIAADAECDEFLQFGSLGNVVRICETDFGAKIDIDVSSIRQQKNGESFAHCAVGKITYSNGSTGYLIYLKASISGDEDVGVAQYRAVHPTFPHESTADQFFSEDQFESYRRLGNHIVEHAFRGTEPNSSHPIALAEKLFNQWAPAGFANASFLKHTRALDSIWERFRTSSELSAFFNELTGRPPLTAPPAGISKGEKCLGLELIQLMEDVFLDIRLDDFWDHPDNRGWAMLFMAWARSFRFRAIWNESKCSFGIRFGYFCSQRLGLSANS
jgi:hypothetical protein